MRNSFHDPLISWLENTRNNLSLHFTDPWPVLLLSATRRRSDIECLGCELRLVRVLILESLRGWGVSGVCTLASMMTFCPQQPKFFLQSTCFPAGWITM